MNHEWTQKDSDNVKLFSDCFEKFDGKTEKRNIFSPEEEKLASDMLRVGRRQY